MENQPDRMKGFRYIAPRHIDLQTTQIPQSSNAEEGKTKRASMACLECKKRRTKCSTGFPCSECATHERDCIYDETADRRRKEHVKSTRNQLQVAENQLQVTEDALGYYHTLLEDLLESFRLASQNQLGQLLQAVQDTKRNPLPEDQNGYKPISEAVYSILAESEDAPGSDIDYDQDMIS